MRILLDNRVDHRFGEMLLGHEVAHARNLGWADLQNGQLLSAAQAAGYEILITVDKGMRHQQNLKGRTISLVTLCPHLVDLQFLEPMAGSVLKELEGPRSSGLSIVVQPDSS